MPLRKKGVGALLEVRMLCARAAVALWREPTELILRCALAGLCGLVLGRLFDDLPSKNGTTAGIQDRFGLLFFLLTYFSLIALSSLPLWRARQLLYIRERDAGVYGSGTYLVATLLVDVAPKTILPPILMTLAAYHEIGLNAQPGHGSAFAMILMLYDLCLTEAPG